MNNNYITERCLKFKVHGDITTNIVCKIANLFIDNDTDFVDILVMVIIQLIYSKTSGKKWNDIIELINSIKPCKYEYKRNILYYR